MSISRKRTYNKNLIEEKAFSLIELAAVITIVGFLIAVIVTGKSLMNAATIHSVASNMERYKESVLVFEKIYKSLPGDMSDAYEYWGADCAVSAVKCNGNGDELVAPATNGDVVEQFMAWKHLSLAELISDRIYSGDDSGGIILGETIPLSEFDNAGYWFVNSTSVYGKNGLVFGLGSVGSDLDRFGGAIVPADAERIDYKIDDGKADDGNLYVSRGIPGVGSICTTKAPSESAPSSFINHDKTKSCALYYWMPTSK